MKTERFLAPSVVVLFLGVLFASLFYRIHLHCTSYFDLGIYSDALNRIRLSDLNPFLPGRNIRIFNDHFDPILVPFSIFTTFIPAPIVGIAVEFLAFVLCWIPIRRLRDSGKITHGVAVFSYAFLLLNHATVDAVQSPFHPTTWAVLPLVWMFSSILLEDGRSLIVSLLFLFACREEFPLIGPPLALVLWMGRRRRLAGWVFFISTAWIFFVFFLRPRVFDGHFENYGSGILRRFFSDPTEAFRKNLTVSALRMHLERTLPLLLLLDLKKLSDLRVWGFSVLVTSAPILGIRFVSAQWGFHYGTAAIICALFLILPGLTLQTSRWRRGLAFLFLFATFIAQPLKVFTSQHSRCPVNPSRLASIESAQRKLAASGKANIILENNLASTQFLISPKSQNIHLLCSPSGTEKKSFEAVLVEKPGSGDPWPCSAARIGEMIHSWKQDPAIRVILEDDFVFMAEGKVLSEAEVR